MSADKRQPVRLGLPADTPIGTRLVAKLTIKDVDHPIYGKINGRQIELPLLLPTGYMEQSNFFKLSLEEQDNLVGKLADNLREVRDTLDEDELRSKTLQWILWNAFLLPLVDVTTEEFVYLVGVTSFGELADDVMDLDEGIGADFESKVLYNRYNMWSDLWTHGKFENLREYAKIYPLLENAMKLFIDSFNGLSKTMGVEAMKTMCRPSFTALESNPLRYNHNHLQNYSEEGLRIIRASNASGDGMLLFQLIACKKELPIKVKESLLFKVFSQSLEVSYGLLNDVIGISKDITNSETNGNSILRHVVYGGLTLEDAYNLEYKRLRNILHDINLASKQLLETFPDVPDLQFILDCCKVVYDSQVHTCVVLAQLKLRYGSSEFFIETI